jgi:hypothetical protein
MLGPCILLNRFDLDLATNPFSHARIGIEKIIAKRIIVIEYGLI